MGFNAPLKSQYAVRSNYTWGIVGFTINIVALLAAAVLVIGALVLIGIVGH